MNAPQLKSCLSELKIIGVEQEPAQADENGILHARFRSPETGALRTATLELIPGQIAAKTFLIRRGVAWKRYELWCLILGGKQE